MWLTRPPPKPTAWGRRLLEKQRIRFHYNVAEKTMKTYMTRAFEKGIEYPVDNLLQQLESRLDNFVWRVGLQTSMAAARCFVKHGHMEVQTEDKPWRAVNIGSMRLKPGDKVRVRREADWPNSTKHARFWQEKEGPVDIPAHIEWDAEAQEGAYLDICDRHDFGLHVEERHILLFYSGQRSTIRRTHIRYFEGTDIPITKSYNGGRIRPTPENLINMERGVGLRRFGRRCPPCLWGRRRPLNSPYNRLR